jgi:hypothetical protein
MVSAIDYMERVLGYTPRAAQDRLRVARALGTLSQLTSSLERGELSFSAIRELARVATPATEAAWRDAAIGKNVRQIEELVADRQPGDNPDDPPDPAIRTRVVRFELLPETFAVLRQARQALDEEHGSRMSDDELVAALCGSVLDGASAAEPSGRARFQIAVTVCERCRQGWQDGAGARLAISAAAVERASCDAQHIGSIDGDMPVRAYQDVPPSVARLVWRRDQGRCRVPGCRSARGLEIHHLVHRAEGGSHDASNLILACSAHHIAHHNGVLTISGSSEQLVVRYREEASITAADHLDVGAAWGMGAAVGHRVEDNASSSDRAHAGVADTSAAMRDPAYADSSDSSASESGRAHVGVATSVGAAVRSPVYEGSGVGESDHTHAGVASDISATVQDPVYANSSASGSGRAHVGVATSVGAAVRSPAYESSGVDESGHTHVGASAMSAAVRDPAYVSLNSSEPARAHVGAVADAVGRDGKTAGGALDAAIVCSQAKTALVGLGWKTAIARAAVAEAAAALGGGATLERLIFEALCRCPRPAS